MKKFYKTVSVQQVSDGYTIQLDNKTIKTPNKQVLCVPTHGLALAIADEWQSVPDGGDVIPSVMDMMCLASTTLDKVIPNMGEIRDGVVEYAQTDVICYRTGTFSHLAQKQAQAWDTWIRYAKDSLDMDLHTTTGIMPIAQSPHTLARARDLVNGMCAFELTAFADMVAVLGSFVVAMAVVRGDVNTTTAFEICHLDAYHQISEWGTDTENEQVLDGKRATVAMDKRFFDLVGA